MSENYTEVTYGLLKCRNYGDYIEITKCACTATRIIIPAEIEGIPINIGKEAFSHCDNLISVIIPDNVKTIGENAFSHCNHLISVTIPDSVISIDEHAFSDCQNLTLVTIPDSVISISLSAFNHCQNLTKINVSENNKYYADIDGVLFNKDKTLLCLYPPGKSESEYIIPNSVKSIGICAFSNCSILESIIIPDSVKSIGSYAFYGCSSLESIIISNGIKSINKLAFNGCSSLKSIIIPDSVTIIGEEAFACCDSLESVTISNSVTSIEEQTFACCDSLESIIIPKRVEFIDENAFDGCYNLTSVTILNPHCRIYDLESTFSYNANEIIYGYKNSTAQKYAEEYDMKFVPLEEKKETNDSETTDSVSNDALKIDKIIKSFTHKERAEFLCKVYELAEKLKDNP